MSSTVTTDTTTTTTDNNNTFRLEPSPQNQGTVQTTLKYLSPSTDFSQRLWYKRPPAAPPAVTTNYESEPYPVSISDVRGHESEFSLDTNGFAFGHVPVDDELLDAMREDMEGTFVRDTYYKDMEKVLAEKVLAEKGGAGKVLVFDHLVRKRPKEGSGGAEIGTEKVPNSPVQAVHVDQSREYAFGFLKKTLEEHAADIGFVVKRAQIINIWRPLIDEVEDFPLTVLDNRTLAPEKFIGSKAVYDNSNFDREIFQVLHDPGHRWHFLSKQKKDECIFIKCFDTEENIAGCAPHTSFENPNAVPGAPPRESCEVRAWVFYPGDDPSEQVEIKTVPEWEKPDLQWTSRWQLHAQT